MKSIEIKFVGEQDVDVCCDGRVTHRLRTKGETYVLTMVSPRTDAEKTPGQFASRSGALAHLTHQLVERASR